MEENKKVIVTEEFTVSKSLLWEVITQHSHQINWFFSNIPSFELEVGYQLLFDVETPNRVFPHFWKVLAIQPQKSFTLLWEYQGYDGSSEVCFSIDSISENLSRLTLTHTVTDPFNQDIEEFRYESCLGGWNYFIKENLKQYVDRLVIK
ncbi:SRPBCC domain-containing protein [Flammeovirga sp. MY04]|uniref:SRPBCC family protein n=1 Tax=Flammeovirga sp. MY04 TaxID=1191459 RepID=UPI00080644B5|nr:SRPBCC domain-containing protein [Flammeovirga sp. MY04]ANQ49018.1 SRPBCC domain-containing protein [Flammeovirga sp. MY04]